MEQKNEKKELLCRVRLCSRCMFLRRGRVWVWTILHLCPLHLPI